MNNNIGFSLVELSIVLVILGLLTGGILTGQNLIKAAELRSVTTEFNHYQSALMSFKGKYFALPGDMGNATAFWDTMTSGTCPNATGGTGTQTCNGNSDGIVSQNAAAAGQTGEGYLFWQHLSNAGMIEGSYSGIAGVNINDDLLGINIPQSKFQQAGWNVDVSSDDDITPNGDHTLYAISLGNHFQLGADHNTSDSDQAIFSPEDAWNIDKKMDDGRPAYGSVIARFWDDACTDATANTDLDSDYKLSDKTTQCTLFFKNAISGR